jgi:hypothetical protein
MVAEIKREEYKTELRMIKPAGRGKPTQPPQDAGLILRSHQGRPPVDGRALQPEFPAEALAVNAHGRRQSRF